MKPIAEEVIFIDRLVVSHGGASGALAMRCSSGISWESTKSK
jgi:hypothetical protein